MAWVRTPDELFERPEVLAIGVDAVAFHLAALGYSNRNLTDGFVPTAKASTLLPIGDAAQLVDRLCTDGWWLAVDGGWRLIYLLDLQPTADQVNERRASGRRRTAGYRSRGKRDATRNGVSDTPCDTPPGGTTYPTPNPDPGPDPLPRPGARSPDRRAVDRVSSPNARVPRPGAADAATPAGNLADTAAFRLQKIVEAVRHGGAAIYPTSRDEVALKSCAAPVELVAEAYVAAARGEWDPGGDGFLVANLSLHMVVDRLAGFEVTRRPRVTNYLDSRYGPMMRGEGHNVHGPGCDCDAAPAPAAGFAF